MNQCRNFNRLHEEVQCNLDGIYKNLSGYLAYTDIERKRYVENNICITYGEVQYLSLIKFSEKIHLGHEDVFLDLGSGLGKICASILLGTACKEAIGIEASENLHQQALTILPKLKAFLEPENKKLNLYKNNFLSPEMLPVIQRATVVFINSTAFTYDLLDKIGVVLNQCPNIRAVLSFKPFANLSLPFNKTIIIEASWDSILARLYSSKTHSN
jgi:precorrin-6B methylase 2